LALALSTAALSPSATASDSPPPSLDQEAGGKLWDSQAQAGITTASGNSNNSTFTGGVTADRDADRTMLHLGADGRYSREGGQATSQRLHGNTQLDYDFKPRVYAFGVLDALNDRFSGYDLQLIEATGLGRRFFIGREDLKWQADLGPALRQQWLTDDSYENSVNARLRTLFEWDFAEDSTFHEQFIWTQSLNRLGEYLISDETAVSFHLNAHLAFQTSIQVQHDSKPPKGAKPTDVFTTTSLIYQF